MQCHNYSQNSRYKKTGLLAAGTSKCLWQRLGFQRLLQNGSPLCGGCGPTRRPLLYSGVSQPLPLLLFIPCRSRGCCPRFLCLRSRSRRHFHNLLCPRIHRLTMASGGAAPVVWRHPSDSGVKPVTALIDRPNRFFDSVGKIIAYSCFHTGVVRAVYDTCFCNVFSVISRRNLKIN